MKVNTIAPLIFALMLLFGVQSCDDREEFSIFDPDYSAPNPDPTLTAITPTNGYLAGVDFIEVAGTNFSSNMSENLIYFDGLPGTILGGSATTLQVRSNAEVTGDAVVVKVAVLGAEFFSNEITYKLDPALVTFDAVNDSDTPWSVAVDANDNIFVHLIRDGADFGIQKIDPTTGVMTEAVPPVNNLSRWFNIRVAPDGSIYGARVPSTRALFRSENGGAMGANYISTDQAKASTFIDFDFDQNDNVWVVGDNDAITKFAFSSTRNTSPTYYDFVANLVSCRVYNNALYVGGSRTENDVTISGVWKLDIDGNGDLGTPELYFDVKAGFNPDATVLDMEFASDGTMLLGVGTTVVSSEFETSGVNEGVIMVKPDKSVEPLYKGVLSPFGINMAWGSGEFLYLVNGKVDRASGGTAETIFPQRFYQVNMLDMRRAPSYGIE